MQLSDIFEKIGIKGIDDLTAEEKKTFRQWQNVLAKPETTIQDLKSILPKELERAYAELRKHDNSVQKDAFYKAYTTLAETILKIITAPEKERSQLTAFLKQKYNL